MATVDNYKVNIEVVGGAALKTAQADIQGLEGTIGGLTNKLNGLATAGLAAFAALSVSAFKMADSIVDLSNATGLSVNTIYSLSTALEQAGGSFDGGNMMVGKFAKALSEAVSGSEKAQEAFTKLGISNQELATMTDEQLFRAAIDGLAGMENGFLKTALATEIFGKEAKNIDFDGLAQDMQDASDPALAEAMIKAAAFVDDLAAAFRNLQVIAVQAFGPILQVVGEFISDAENMKKVIQVVGALLAAAFAARIVGAIIATVNAMRLLGAAIKAAGVAQAFLTGLTGVGLLAVAASAAAATAAYYALGKAMDSAGKAGAPAAVPKGGDTPAPGTQLRDVQTPKSGKDSQASATAKAMREQAQSAQETTRQLMLQNEESNKLRELEISLIGISSERANLIKSNAQAQSTATKDIAKLEADINEERAKGTKANQAVIIELQKQIAEKNNQLGVTLQLNQAEYNRTLEIAKQNNLLMFQKESMNQYIKNTEDLVAMAERMKILSGESSQEEYDRAMVLHQLKLQNLNTLHQLGLDLDAATKAKDNAEIDAIRQKIKLENERYTGAVKHANRETTFQDNLRQSSKAGIRSAIENAKRITEPFYMAEAATASLFSNMNSALDNFVETGKFKFGSFAKSVIADLAKIALKAAATKLITSIFGAGIFGKAAGGPVMANKPYLVGEQGPELFVPNSAGSIMTNASMNRNAGVGESIQPVVNNITNITNNISAIDSRSVAQMFVENRKSLLGASMMARKEMPYGG